MTLSLLVAVSLGLLGQALAVCTTEKDALTAIYDAMGGTGWPTNNWLSAEHHCAWTGITCNPVGLVVGIDLSSMNLTGQIPDDIACLPYLKSLYMNDNQMSSTLPAAICDLTNLQYLQIQDAGLHGAIPTCVCTMKHLQYMYLSANSLTGEIPACISGMTFLRGLYLYCNALSGDIPADIWDLNFLEELRVQCNTNLVCSDAPAGRNMIVLCGTGSDMQCELCPVPNVNCPDCVDLASCGQYCRNGTAGFPALEDVVLGSAACSPNRVVVTEAERAARMAN